MSECNICYEQKKTFEICNRTCCAYTMCNECSDRLLENKCPFCRKDFTTRRNSISSMREFNPIHWVHSMDDMYVDSRWYRRRMRRQERNRQLEVNNMTNRNTPRRFYMRKVKSRIKSDVRRQVKDYLYERSHSKI